METDALAALVNTGRLSTIRAIVAVIGYASAIVVTLLWMSWRGYQFDHGPTSVLDGFVLAVPATVLFGSR
jgi:hypothetical protein